MPDTHDRSMDWAIMDLVSGRGSYEESGDVQPVSHTALLFPDCLSAWGGFSSSRRSIVKVFSVDDVNSDIWLNTPWRRQATATALRHYSLDRFPFENHAIWTILLDCDNVSTPHGTEPGYLSYTALERELWCSRRQESRKAPDQRNFGRYRNCESNHQTSVAARPDWKPAHRFSLTHELRSIIYLVRCRADGMFEAPELLALVLSYLPLMDLLRYGDVCKATRCQVRMLLRTRVLHYTRPFFPSKTKLFDFAASLTRLQSWIVGSVPLAVLSLCADVAVPDNLNIICGHHAIDTSDGWHTFLVSNLGFHHVETTARTVTVTAAKKQTLAELLFAAPNTSQWNAISETAVISPCVQMTSNHEGLQGWRQGGWRRRPVVTPLTASLPKETPWPTVIKLHPSTRIAKGLRGIGRWDWNEKSGLWRDYFSTFSTQGFTWTSCRSAHIRTHQLEFGRSSLFALLIKKAMYEHQCILIKAIYYVPSPTQNAKQPGAPTRPLNGMAIEKMAGYFDRTRTPIRQGGVRRLGRDGSVSAFKLAR
ncbi:hypothetical protein B0H13DRAFT_1909400 [Mycena leptocephala]|nr:hypothetical protein B0H13DRAFT_1909400 [Mycena leptocephala]